MIARHESAIDKNDIWAQISAPLPAGSISWRQDGRPVERAGKYIARFVAYVDAQTVRERLDDAVPGEWDLTLELLPTPGGFADDDGEAKCAFKARLQILGVIREDVGQGSDYKQAATDAFKRAAVRFGIAHELYSYEQNWVQVDGDGKYAKPVEDPSDAYARRMERKGNGAATGNAPTAVRVDRGEAPRSSTTNASQPAPAPAADTGPLSEDEPACPKCGGKMWDNRITKRNSKAPDYKCRSRSCDGVVWPPKKQRSEPEPGEIRTSRPAFDLPEEHGFPPPDDDPYGF